MGFFSKRRAVGLDIGAGIVRALTLEGSADKPVITGVAAAAVVSDDGNAATAQAIHAALAQARADGESVVASVGGPDVIVRQVALPALPPERVRQVLELQHREFGLLPPGEGVLEAQILSRSKTGCSVLAVSIPKPLIEARTRLLEQAAVKLRTLDVEALALMNGALHVAKVEAGELLVMLNLWDERAILCLRSDRGPLIVRHLDVGAAALIDRVRKAGVPVATATGTRLATQEIDGAKAFDACHDIVQRVAEEIRRSLSFYRSEYDRDARPRYMLGGWLRLRQWNRWLTDELGLESPFEVLDPFQAAQLAAPRTDVDESAGSEFLQAFGLALRAL